VNTDGSNPEKFVDNCGAVTDIDAGGQYLLGVVWFGEKSGIYEVPTSNKKCITLLPGVETINATIARDGKSFFYAVVSRGETSIFRQLWKDGKTIAAPQLALKVPFALPTWYANHAAYDELLLPFTGRLLCFGSFHQLMHRPPNVGFDGPS